MEAITGLGGALPLKDTMGRGRAAGKRRKGSGAVTGNPLVGRREKKMMELIRQLLEVCTCEAPSGRIPDMRGITEALTPLCPDQEGRLGTRGIVWPEGIRCDKNIIMM